MLSFKVKLEEDGKGIGKGIAIVKTPRFFSFFSSCHFCFHADSYSRIYIYLYPYVYTNTPSINQSLNSIHPFLILFLCYINPIHVSHQPYPPPPLPNHPSLFNDPWADIPSHQLPFSVNKYTIRPKDKCRGRGEHARRSQTMLFYLKYIIINLRVKCLELSFAG